MKSICAQQDFGIKEVRKNNYFDDKESIDRDMFFIGKGWIIIRFSERQIITNPQGCYGTVAKVIVELTQDSALGEIAKLSTTLKLDSR